ncbi:MAG: tetratricopeptide repeat protein [Saprospiraceae bacterium]|nr:tetratricopeptide repeat protein [Saprospiraceae bacterium]
MEYSGDEVFDRIEILSEQGEAYIKRGKYRSALQKFWKAYELLPEPKTQYPSGTWLLTAIGDLNFIVGNFGAGKKNLSKALEFPTANKNGFINFRLAQCLFELGNKTEALIEFNKAVKLEDIALFDDEDPKYRAFFDLKI